MLNLFNWNLNGYVRGWEREWNGKIYIFSDWMQNWIADRGMNIYMLWNGLVVQRFRGIFWGYVSRKSRIFSIKFQFI